MSANVSANPHLDGERVVYEDPFKVLFAPGRKPTYESLRTSGLLSSIEIRGLLVPGITYPSPNGDVCGEGNHRLGCCQHLRIPFVALRFPKPLSEVELIDVQLTSDIKVHLTPDEFADKVERWLKLTGATQEAAALRYSKSPGQISKILAPLRRLIPELHDLYHNPAFCRDGIRVIATMPTPDLQKELAARGLALVKDGKPVKRDWLERVAKQLKGKAPKNERRRKIKWGDFALEAPSMLSCEEIREKIKPFLDALAEAIKKGWGPDTLPPLMGA